MDKIKQQNYIPLFPKLIGDYKISFTESEEKYFDNWFDSEWIYRKCKLKESSGDETACQEEHGPLRDYDNFFQILNIEENILTTNPNLYDIKNALLECVYHYSQEVLGNIIHPETDLTICDSWIIKLKGGTQPQDIWFEDDNNWFFRKHYHGFAWLTCVLYLDDSDNGIIIHDPHAGHRDRWPWGWEKRGDGDNMNVNEFEVINAEKGRILIFPANYDHSLVVSKNNVNFRRSIVANIWPAGLVCDKNASKLDLRYGR